MIKAAIRIVLIIFGALAANSCENHDLRDPLPIHTQGGKS